MKGIVITAENQQMLVNKFTTGEDLEQFPIGYVLITDFGNEDTFETLTPELFAAKFTAGENLKNDFFDVIPKE